MYICHVITRMIIGGAQENTLLSVQGHLENGHQCRLLTGPTQGPEGQLLHDASISGLIVDEIPSLSRAIHPFHDLRAYIACRRYFKKHAFDVVHTHSSKAGIIARIAARHAGIKVVVHTVHGQSFHPYQAHWKNLLYIFLEKIAARYCDRIFSVADAMTHQCVKAGIAPFDLYRTVYSGMDLTPFLTSTHDPELANRLGIEAHHKVIGKIARIFELKGYDCFIEVATRVVKKDPDVRFLIVGDGLLRPWLEEKVRDHGLKSHVIFAGLVAPADIPQYIALMDILIHLSLREGLPRVVTQALACEKPAIAYHLDGTPEVVIHGKTGFTCPPSDVSAIVTATQRLLHDETLRHRLGKNGRQHVYPRWDWRQMVTLLEAHYGNLLEPLQPVQSNDEERQAG